MKISSFPFQTINWNDIEPEAHSATTGTVSWKVFSMGDIRVRMVTYSPNYVADHWCSKGHILLCISGSMITKLEDGREFILTSGMSYHVGDNNEAHSSRSPQGCTLFIVD